MSWLRDGDARADHLEAQRTESLTEAPGRTGALITAWFVGSLESFGELTDAEQTVVDVTGRVATDEHDDAPLMASLAPHFTHAEQVTIMLHLAVARSRAAIDAQSASTVSDGAGRSGGDTSLVAQPR